MMHCSRHCVNNLRTLSKSLLKYDGGNLSQQIRTTFILKRRHPAPLLKKGQNQGRLKRKHYIYDLIEDTNVKPQKPLDVILLKDVDGIGEVGQQVSVKPDPAYKTLLLPGLAVYASPENIEKYKHLFSDKSKEEDREYTSQSVKKTIKILSTFCLSVVMSIDQPWTLEKWHVRASFRKAGVRIPDEAITMPDKVITGPDLAKENKEFYITVTVNNDKQVKVRCRIHHWGNASKSLPYVPEFWKLPSEPIFAEDKPILDSLPVHKEMQEKLK